ncbi:putative nucleotidyltransferase, ribonuclease H, partial [Tanacetum coccineum]
MENPHMNIPLSRRARTRYDEVWGGGVAVAYKKGQGGDKINLVAKGSDGGACKINDGGLMMDAAKIKAIQDWEPPTKVTELRSFLGLDKECQAAFESLKKAFKEEPVLRLPDVTMPFELHTNASDFAIGGVLMQDGHLIAFESWKLNETEKKYTLGKANVVADTLSHKAKFGAITQAQFFLQDQIKEGLEHDPLGKKIIALAKDRRTRRFWLKGDMLFTKGDQLYVPKWGDLRKEILKECHDSKWAGHPGITRTLSLVEGTYYWTRMGSDVETFLEEGGSIIVVVDRFSKYGTFIAAPPDVTADDMAKLFFMNMQRTEDTGKSPFELVTGNQPLTPNVLAASYEGSSPAAYKTIKEWHEQVDLAWASLDKEAKKMKKYEGPFPVIGHVGKVSYRVQLPPKLKIHPVFHVNFLKPYHGDEEDPERGVSKRAPREVVTSYDQEVEEILSDQVEEEPQSFGDVEDESTSRVVDDGVKSVDEVGACQVVDETLKRSENMVSIYLVYHDNDGRQYIANGFYLFSLAALSTVAPVLGFVLHMPLYL